MDARIVALPYGERTRLGTARAPQRSASHVDLFSDRPGLRRRLVNGYDTIFGRGVAGWKRPSANFAVSRRTSANLRVLNLQADRGSADPLDEVQVELPRPLRQSGNSWPFCEGFSASRGAPFFVCDGTSLHLQL